MQEKANKEYIESYLRQCFQNSKYDSENWWFINPIKQSENIRYPEHLIDRMNTFHHQDHWHHGETIMEHTIEVYNSIDAITVSKTTRNLLKKVAIFHDIGKCATRTFNEKVNRYSFKGHPKASRMMAEKLLPHDKDRNKILMLVENHDILQQLWQSKQDMGETKNPYKYLHKFMRRAISFSPMLGHLLLFALADSSHLARKEEMKDRKMSIYNDITCARLEEVNKYEKEMQKQMKLRRLMYFDTDIFKYINELCPDAVELYPDLSAIKRHMGQKEMYQEIKELEAYLDAQIKIVDMF